MSKNSNVISKTVKEKNNDEIVLTSPYGNPTSHYWNIGVPISRLSESLQLMINEDIEELKFYIDNPPNKIIDAVSSTDRIKQNLRKLSTLNYDNIISNEHLNSVLNLLKYTLRTIHMKDIKDLIPMYMCMLKVRNDEENTALIDKIKESSQSYSNMEHDDKYTTYIVNYNYVLLLVKKYHNSKPEYFESCIDVYLLDKLK